MTDGTDKPGFLRVVGLGPGSRALVTEEVRQALEQADDIVGYAPYVERVPARADQRVHKTDNREEISRAAHALDLAAAGRRVVVVSSGDPGVFAMAAAVFEVLEQQPERQNLDIAVLPGVTAMLAAAARVGAPLGHDFCVLNLSDNLKSFAVIERRLRAASQGDFAMAFYNPRSKARPEQFSRALDILCDEGLSERTIIFARAVTTPEENLQITTVAQAKPEMADMRTIVLVGNSQTRMVGRFIFTPRVMA